MTTVPPRLLHHAAITTDALTLLLGGLTQRVTMTLPSEIMGGVSCLAYGGSFPCYGGLESLSIQDSGLMELVLLPAMGGFMGGLPFIIGMSLPMSSHKMVSRLLLT